MALWSWDDKDKPNITNMLTFLYLSIKTVLLDLPSIVDTGQVKLPPGARKPPQSYTKLVIKGERERFLPLQSQSQCLYSSASDRAILGE